jgi:hypothetical protein
MRQTEHRKTHPRDAPIARYVLIAFPAFVLCRTIRRSGAATNADAAPWLPPTAAPIHVALPSQLPSRSLRPAPLLELLGLSLLPSSFSLSWAASIYRLSPGTVPSSHSAPAAHTPRTRHLALRKSPADAQCRSEYPCLHAAPSDADAVTGIAAAGAGY